jgi:hypothetical protein
MAMKDCEQPVMFDRYDRGIDNFENRAPVQKCISRFRWRYTVESSRAKRRNT